MGKLEISVVEFKNLVTIGGTGVTLWSAKRPEFDYMHGKQSIREVRDERGVTLAVFIGFDAGKVQQEVEVPAANIRSICRLPAQAEPEKPSIASGKAGAK